MKVGLSSTWRTTKYFRTNRKSYEKLDQTKGFVMYALDKVFSGKKWSEDNGAVWRVLSY